MLTSQSTRTQQAAPVFESIMNKIAQTLRVVSKAKFKLLNHRTVKDIPTDEFNKIIESLIKNGWKKVYEYDGFDAWIDYGKLILKNKNKKLLFEWDNWTEGSIEAEKILLKRSQQYIISKC